jgi:hypothetical protein
MVSLMGRWNWWLPRPLAWLLRVPEATPPAAQPASQSVT